VLAQVANYQREPRIHSRFHRLRVRPDQASAYVHYFMRLPRGPARRGGEARSGRPLRLLARGCRKPFLLLPTVISKLAQSELISVVVRKNSTSSSVFSCPPNRPKVLGHGSGMTTEEKDFVPAMGHIRAQSRCCDGRQSILEIWLRHRPAGRVVTYPGTACNCGISRHRH
jgi:hypothetical protein